MTEIRVPSTPEQVRRFLMSSIRISNSPVVLDSVEWIYDSESGERRRGFEFFEFTDGANDEIGLIAVDPLTAQRFEIRIREEG